MWSIPASSDTMESKGGCWIKYKTINIILLLYLVRKKVKMLRKPCFIQRILTFLRFWSYSRYCTVCVCVWIVQAENNIQFASIHTSWQCLLFSFRYAPYTDMYLHWRVLCKFKPNWVHTTRITTVRWTGGTGWHQP